MGEGLKRAATGVAAGGWVGGGVWAGGGGWVGGGGRTVAGGLTGLATAGLARGGGDGLTAVAGCCGCPWSVLGR